MSRLRFCYYYLVPSELCTLGYLSSLALIFLISKLKKIVVFVRTKSMLYIKLLGQWLTQVKCESLSHSVMSYSLHPQGL